MRSFSFSCPNSDSYLFPNFQALSICASRASLSILNVTICVYLVDRLSSLLFQGDWRNDPIARASRPAGRRARHQSLSVWNRRKGEGRLSASPAARPVLSRREDRGPARQASAAHRSQRGRSGDGFGSRINKNLGRAWGQRPRFKLPSRANGAGEVTTTPAVYGPAILNSRRPSMLKSKRPSRQRAVDRSST